MEGEVIKRKDRSSNVKNPPNEDIIQKRTVPTGLLNFLEWDKTMTNSIVTLFQQKFPNLTKSETKFMEVLQFAI